MKISDKSLFIITLTGALVFTVLGWFIGFAYEFDSDKPYQEEEWNQLISIAMLNVSWFGPWIILQAQRKEYRRMKRSFLLLVCFTLPFVLLNLYHPKFDSRAWKDSLEPYPYKRSVRYTEGRMLHDLVESDLLVGMNQEQVIELLGGHYESRSARSLVYHIWTFPYYQCKDKVGIWFEDGIFASCSIAGCD